MKIKSVNAIDVKGCYIAGGSVLSRVTKTEIADYDVYPKTKEALLNTCIGLLDDGAFVVNISDRAVTFKHNNVVSDNGERAIVQVMRFDEFTNPEKIFEFFDFTVCMGAYDCDDDTWHFQEDFWADVAAKTLRFNPKTKYPLASLIRTAKYQKKGYHLNKGESAKIGLAVASHGLPTSWDELESQIGGVYGKSIKVEVGEEEFSIEQAHEILSDLEYNVTYSDEEDFYWINKDHLSIILDDAYKTLYKIGGDYYSVYEDSLVATSFDDRLEEYCNVMFADASECPVKFITAYKHLKKQNDEYVGGVYHGDHNGITYSDHEKTTYDKRPYLSSYKKKSTVNKGDYWAEVKIPIEDLVETQYDKYVSKSIIVGEIKSG